MFICTVSVVCLVEFLVRLLPLQASRSTMEVLTLSSMMIQLVNIEDSMTEACGVCAELAESFLSLICELTKRGIPTLALI